MRDQGHNMTCAEMEALLCDYVDGTLANDLRTAVEQHLAGCAACAELARDASAGLAFLASVPRVEPPDELVTRLLYEAPAGRQRRRAPGWREIVTGWMRPVLQPRLAMGMAMTILSVSLLGKFVGVEERALRPSDLHPARVWEQVEDRFHRQWDGLVKYYENLRVVIEIQNRLEEWTEAGEVSAPGRLPPPSDVEAIDTMPERNPNQ